MSPGPKGWGFFRYHAANEETNVTQETIPKFEIKSERNDTSTQVRVQELENGFVVKTGDKPIHYPNIEEAAEAVKQGLIAAEWPSKAKTNDK